MISYCCRNEHNFRSCTLLLFVYIIIIIMLRIFVVTDSLSALILNVNYWFCTNSLSAALSCDNLNFSMTIFIPSKFLTMHE